MHLYEKQPSGTVAEARALRRDATEAEKHLRRTLKVAFPALKWRFQRARAQHGKDEGDKEKGDAAITASPSPFRGLTAAPSLSRWEREL